jgi:sarcosine oxidase delta subunit
VLRDHYRHSDPFRIASPVHADSIFGRDNLRDLLRSYQQYYNGCRTHLSLDKDAPLSRAVTAHGRIAVSPVLGGLQHQYCRI